MGLRRFLGALLIVAITATLAGLWVGGRQSSGPRRLSRPPAMLQDLYGNPLNRAVATYGIDALGETVEEHYPAMPVDRLPPPEA
jgi:hypothetical protein